MDEDDALDAPAAADGAPAEEQKVSQNVADSDEQEDEGVSTGADDGADGEDDEPDDERPRKPSRSARMAEKIRRQQAEIEELRQKVGSPASKPEDIEAAIRKEIGEPPKESDFQDWFEYQDARQAYTLKRTLAERDLKDRAGRDEQRIRERARDLVNAHEERVEKAREVLPDFDKALRSTQASGVVLPPYVHELILESEKSAHLVYHLAKNHDRLKALAGMSPVAAAREIGRIEARLTTPNPNRQTKAPAPVRPVKGGAAPSNPDADLDAWLKKEYGPRA